MSIWRPTVPSEAWIFTGKVPRKCMRVHRALLGDYGTTPYIVETRGWMRVKDLLDLTGHPCDDRKFRELKEIIDQMRGDNPRMALTVLQRQRGRYDDFRYGLEPQQIKPPAVQASFAFS